LGRPRIKKTMPSKTPVTIEVVSDVVCPWCYIGKRRLEKALALLGDPAVQVRWGAYELNPGAPKEGYNRPEYRARKFGNVAYAKQLEQRVAAAAAEEGLQFQFDRIERVPNTFDAHRLIWLAGRNNVQDAVVERLFRAYFIDAEDVGSPETLRRIGIESGLSAEAIDHLFRTDLGVGEVRAEEERARTEGVTGVPTFFVDGEPITSGAHPPQLLAAMFAPALSSTGQCSIEEGTCV
jgi:predicted DsbA family dithiol-disulfide isomerase